MFLDGHIYKRVLLAGHIHKTPLGYTIIVMYMNSVPWSVPIGILRPCFDLSCSAPSASTASKLVYQTSSQLPVSACQTESRVGRVSACQTGSRVGREQVFLRSVGRAHLFMVGYLLFRLGQQVIWKKGTHVQW